MKKLTIREVIDTLLSMTQDKVVKLGYDHHLDIQDGDCFDSWRGDYTEAMLCYSRDGKPATVIKVIQCIKNNLNFPVYGYKGGEYYFKDSTPLNLAVYGRSFGDGAGVVKIKETEDCVYILSQNDLDGKTKTFGI